MSEYLNEARADKLNSVLEALLPFFNHVNADKLLPLLNGKVDSIELSEFLRELEKDGHIEFPDIRFGYRIKESGKQFLKNGGYVKLFSDKIEKEKREIENHQNNIAMKKQGEIGNSINSKNIVIGVLAIIVALLIFILSRR